MRWLIRRLGPGDTEAAAELYAALADWLDAPGPALRPAEVDALLARTDLWSVAAFDGTRVIGGLTAHVLPMTRAAGVELFIYDLAVAESHRRLGVGRALLAFLRRQDPGPRLLGIFVFAAADDEAEAGAFYRACGGEAAAATMYSFGAEAGSTP